jgi:hypothetical protein
MLLSRYLLIAAFALAIVSCSQRAFDPTTEGERLLRRDSEWADLATAGKDIEKVLSYWACCSHFPGETVLEEGCDSCLRHASLMLRDLNPLGLAKPVFSPDGEFPHMRGTTTSPYPRQAAVR